MPRMGSLVCASPVDAAIHDAFGVAANIDTYQGYGPDHMASDLSEYLGQEFSGLYIADFLKLLAPQVEAFHLAGGSPTRFGTRLFGCRAEVLQMPIGGVGHRRQIVLPWVAPGRARPDQPGDCTAAFGRTGGTLKHAPRCRIEQPAIFSPLQ